MIGATIGETFQTSNGPNDELSKPATETSLDDILEAVSEESKDRFPEADTEFSLDDILKADESFHSGNLWTK